MTTTTTFYYFSLQQSHVLEKKLYVPKEKPILDVSFLPNILYLKLKFSPFGFRTMDQRLYRPAISLFHKLSFQVPKNPLFCGLWQERLYHPSPCRIRDDPRQPTNSQLSKPTIFCSQRYVVKPGLFSSNAAKSCEMIYQTSNRIVTIGKKWTKDELQMFDYLRWSRMILKDHQ